MLQDDDLKVTVKCNLELNLYDNKVAIPKHLTKKKTGSPEEHIMTNDPEWNADIIFILQSKNAICRMKSVGKLESRILTGTDGKC